MSHSVLSLFICYAPSFALSLKCDGGKHSLRLVTTDSGPVKPYPSCFCFKIKRCFCLSFNANNMQRYSIDRFHQDHNAPSVCKESTV